MNLEIKARPANSLVLVMDRTAGIIPESMDEMLIASTPSCVAVGTLCELDGITLISLSDQPPTDPMLLPVFDGILETPNRRLAVCGVLREALMEMLVPGTTTRVRIWTNHSTEPDRIKIVAT